MNIVFLDLEETLIDEWNSANILAPNVDKIRQAIPADARLGIMSWAVWNMRDKDRFNLNMRADLERLLGKSFDDNFIWSMETWAFEFFKSTGKFVEKDDFFDILKKEDILFILSRCHSQFKDATVMLIDDAVQHGLESHSVQNNCSMKIININAI